MRLSTVDKYVNTRKRNIYGIMQPESIVKTA